MDPATPAKTAVAAVASAVIQSLTLLAKTGTISSRGPTFEVDDNRSDSNVSPVHGSQTSGLDRSSSGGRRR
jgi:hypothetical protein